MVIMTSKETRLYIILKLSLAKMKHLIKYTTYFAASLRSIRQKITTQDAQEPEPPLNFPTFAGNGR